MRLSASFLVSVLVLFIANSADSLQVARDDASKCNFASFLSTFNAFVSASKLPSGVNYTASGVNLHKIVKEELANAYLKNGAEGARERLLSFCRAKAEMYSHMLPSDIANCIDATTFLAHGFSVSTAYMLKKFFVRMDYQCGSALESYLQNMDGFMFANLNMTDSFKTCSKAFLKGMRSTDAKDYCKALDNYCLCQANIFLTSSKDVGLAYSACEMSRIGEIVTLPLCSAFDSPCSVERIEQQN